MIKRLFILTAVGLLLCSGCTKKKAPETTKTDTPPDIPLNPMAQPPMMPQPPAAPAFPTDTNTILADVNGETFTIGEANQQIMSRLAAMARQGIRIPPDRFEEFRPMILLQVVDQFLAKTLLSQEAKAKKLEVSKADEQEAIDKIKQSLPPGVTFEQAMAQSKMDPKAMTDELIESIRITKLLAPFENKERIVTPEAVSEFREKNKEQVTTPPVLEARHILLLVDRNAEESVRNEKKKALEDIRKQLIDGADFAELATKHSDDSGSSQRGGMLPPFGPGDMVPPFEKAALSQEIGVIGPIVETTYGYHVIKVEKHDKAGEVSSEKIIQELKNRQLQAELAKYLDGLKAKAKITTHPALATIRQPNMMRPPRGEGASRGRRMPPRPMPPRPMPTPPPAAK